MDCFSQWHGLSREEQAKYYEKSRMERQKHLQMYPHWNARDNYRFGVKKKKRKRDRSDDPGKPSQPSLLIHFPHSSLQWHALTKNQQSKYYEMARHERNMHMQMHPNWSARENYAKSKKKRKKKDKVRDGNNGKAVCLFVIAVVSSVHCSFCVKARVF